MQCSSRVRRPSRICITDPIGEFQGASGYARTIGDKHQEFTPPIILWPSGAARAVWSDAEKNHRSVILARQQSVVRVPGTISGLVAKSRGTPEIIF